MTDRKFYPWNTQEKSIHIPTGTLKKDQDFDYESWVCFQKAKNQSSWD